MDDLDCHGSVVDQTLRELDVINRLLGGNQISISAFKQMVRKQNHEISFADLGCGGGDIMQAMALWTRTKKGKVLFHGIDANPNIVQYAIKNNKDFPEITFSAENILADSFAEKSFDIIHCCLFLHHFTNEELIRLFGQFKSQARLGVIINDLHRHSLAYYSIKWLTSWFSKSTMVKNDSIISVSRGFRKSELEDMLKQAGITTYQLSWKWAFRWKLIF